MKIDFLLSKIRFDRKQLSSEIVLFTYRLISVYYCLFYVAWKKHS